MKYSMRNLQEGKGHICLLGASFSTRNLGVSVLSDGAVGFLRRAYPHSELRLIDYGKTPLIYRSQWNGKEEVLTTTPIRFSKHFFQRNNIGLLLLIAGILRCIPGKRVRQFIGDKFPMLGTMMSARMSCGISGGDSFSDIYGLKRFFYVALPMIVAQQTRVPFVLLPQTFGPFRSRISRLIAWRIVRNSKLVFTRDTDGPRRLLDVFGRDGKMPIPRFCPDVAFAVQPDPVSRRLLPSGFRPSLGSKPVVGLNVSGLLYMGGYRHRNMFGLRDDYRDLVVRISREIVRGGGRLVLIPHVGGGFEHAESDATSSRTILERLRSEGLKNVELLTGIEDHRKLKYVIGMCHFFIGSRMHSCIAALSQAVPTIGLAYSDKFHGVFESAGVGDWVVDLRSTGREEVSRSVQEGIQRRGEIHRMLTDQLQRIETILAQRASEIKEYVEEGWHGTTER